jgi:lipoprotein NlpI
LDIFHKTLQLNPSLAFPRYYIWLINVRLGKEAEATKELIEYLNSTPVDERDDWFVMIGQFLAGNKSEEDLLRIAKGSTKDLDKKNERLCAVYFYIGMKHLLAGDKVEASEFLKKSIDTKCKQSVEYYSAEAELRSLKRSVLNGP